MRRIVVLAGAGAAALVVATAIHDYGVVDRYDRGNPIAYQFTLAGERSFAAWYASALLITVAGAFVLCYLAERKASGARSRAWGWLVIAAGFAGLSLDELGSVHERFGDAQSFNVFGDASVTWAGVLALPFLLCAVALGAFAWVRLRRHPRVLALFAAGTLLFGSVLLQEEAEIQGHFERSAAAQLAGEPVPKRPIGFVLLEEGTEIAGSLAFLLAAFLYAHRVGSSAPPASRWTGTVAASITPRELRIGSRVAVAALAAGLVAAAAVHIVAPTPNHGDPLPWFPAVVALLAGCAVLLLPAPGLRLDLRVLLGTACLMWSVDQGATFLMTEAAWEGSPRMQLGTRLVMAAATAGVGVYAALAAPAGPPRRSVIGWGVLAAAAPLTGHAVAIAATVFAAHSVLLIGAVDQHLRTTGYPPATGRSSTK